MCKTSPIVSKVELIVKDRENCTCIQLGWNGNGVMSLRKMSGTLQFKTCTFHLQIGKNELETMCKTSPIVSKVELIVKDRENCTCIQLGWNGNGVMSLRKMSGTLQFKTCTFHLQIGKNELETMCKTSPIVSKLELIVKDPENCKSRRWRSSRTWLEYQNRRKYKVTKALRKVAV